MAFQTIDIITQDEARTLDGLFRERVRRSPNTVAYSSFHKPTHSWKSYTWAEMGVQTLRWQRALEGESLMPGDRVAIWMGNCPEWVMMDQAALGLGLVTVPLYGNDRPENVAYILRDAGVKLLLVEKERHFKQLIMTGEDLGPLKRVLSLQTPEEEPPDPRLRGVDSWLKPEKEGELKKSVHDPDSLATIVYTSGTTGNPKGVKLSHSNILWNANRGLESVPAFTQDIFLSFLPLSHTFERTAGYYMPIMAGAAVTYARSAQQLGEDLESVRPTVIISVPRAFERIYSKVKTQLEDKPFLARRLFEWTIQAGWDRFLLEQKKGGWRPSFLFQPLLDKLVAEKIRKKLGGRLRLAISGGAALSPEIGKAFIGLGIPILQGYGMTETSPVVSVNRLDNNDPASVGLILRDVEVRIGANEELLVKSPGVMQGYWNNEDATAQIMDEEGWLHTGDKARIEKERVYITGRIKEIIVMANGEKVPPADIEMAVAADPLIEQMMVIGEGKPYLSALAVLNEKQCALLASKHGYDFGSLDFLTDKRVQKFILGHISRQMHAFPGYAKVRRVALLKEPWSIENGLMTPTLKLRRNRILEQYREEVSRLYEGHEV